MRFITLAALKAVAIILEAPAFPLEDNCLVTGAVPVDVDWAVASRIKEMEAVAEGVRGALAPDAVVPAALLISVEVVKRQIGGTH